MAVRAPEPVAWMSLVDISGPFLAGTVLEEVFPQGLDKVETPRRQRLRSAYEEWRDAVDESDAELDKLHDAWVRMVVTEALEYEADVLAWNNEVPANVFYRSPEHGKELRPDLIVRNGDADPKLLISFYPPRTNLDGALADREWPISPAERMTLLCRASSCRIGLITNGEQWMLVNAPVGETSGYVSWYSRLWWQEPVTLKAFQSLLGVRRCFGPEQETLPRLLERSLDFQEEVTNTLGEQVRRAVEVLIQSLGRADQDRNGELLKDVEPDQLYEAGLAVMMRLVFILCAEERGLLLLGDPVYDQHYAVSTLRSKLREDADQHSDEVLEKRQDAWSRLLSVFRIIYGGVDHESLRLPALGGSLFDPDKFPFLEGRSQNTTWLNSPAIPLPIDNRTVLLLMTALQVLNQQGGAHLLSYRALDVEQIGHVYEGLLEFTAARVPEVTLGLIGTKKSPNPQITLRELESATSERESLLDTLHELTGRSLPALRKALDNNADRDALATLAIACSGQASLITRLLPFIALIRSDSWGNLLVYPEGSFAIVKGTDRRSSGTHYTPRSLTEPIVRYTLEPLVYFGPAQGLPQDRWRVKPSAELLTMNVCDMACGSGAFLVEACRYLSQRLVEAWASEEAKGLAIGIDGVARASSSEHELLPVVLNDRLLVARRLVAQSCLYGVDINHLAVELAKLSLWLVTLAKNKPFSFLDHALRCGDSLVGIHDLEQLRFYNLKPDAEHPDLFKGPLDKAVDVATKLRLRLEGMPANTVADIDLQEHILAEAQDKVARLKCAADLLVSADFWAENASDKQERTRQAAALSSRYAENGPTEAFQRVAAHESRGQKWFHWPLEFPEVVANRGGFDAFVGNPPFMGGKLISTSLGSPYAAFLREHFIDAQNTADLCAYFFQRCFAISNESGTFGLLATNSLAQGDTADAALKYPVSKGATIYRAESSFRWPGKANVFASSAFISRATFESHRVLDGATVAHISHRLLSDDVQPEPYVLGDQPAKAFVGSFVRGDGFILSEDEALQLVQQDSQNANVIFPYLNGADLYSSDSCSATRRIVNFFDWPIESSCSYTGPFEIIRSRVKPFRDGVKEKGARELWWQYAGLKAELYSTVSKLPNVLVRARVSDTHAIVLVDASQVFSDQIVVFGTDSGGVLAVLQSAFHEAWARKYGSTLKGDMRYSPTDCFDNFPFPSSLSSLLEVGSNLNTFRNEVLTTLRTGMTSLYHKVHEPDELSSCIQNLRALHTELDQAVAVAYGWTDFDLGHGFHETTKGTRFTICDQARREVLQRLLKLNHRRHEEEVRHGRTRRSGKKQSNVRRKPIHSKQISLIPNPENAAIEMEVGDTLYFAYGSNMSKGRKQERTGLIRSARKAKLGGYQLAFNKDGGARKVYANISHSPNADVWGVVYLCNEAAMTELDRREGVIGGHYERANVTVELESGELIEAVTYVAGDKFVVEEATPTVEYLGFILEGAEQHSLPSDYIEAVRKLATGLETA